MQRWTTETGSIFLRLVNSTYWLSQFTVLSAVLLWVYLSRNNSYLLLRNTLFAVNTLGLIGYAVMPTAPPRLLPSQGFVDTVSGSAISLNSGAAKLLANPYAAMPSLHAADAVVVAAVLASVIETRAARPWVILWPLWVGFCLVATGNHFLVDVLAGSVLGAVGIAAVSVFGARPVGAPSATGAETGVGRNRAAVVGHPR